MIKNLVTWKRACAIAYIKDLVLFDMMILKTCKWYVR